MNSGFIPDIVSYHRKKIKFYEVKPGYPLNVYNIKDPFLKETQEKWIIENCLKKKIPVDIVFYRQKKKKIRGGWNWDFYHVALNKKNIKEYSQTSSDDERFDTLAWIESHFEKEPRREPAEPTEDSWW